jgi:hypothetical protein
MRTSRAASLRGSCLVLLCLGLAACTSLGPRTLPRDRFDYSAAIAQSRNEHMLLNIVRLRYMQMPNFLTVSSVIAGYTYEGGIGVSGTKAINPFDESTISGAANLRYQERPTITYSPLAGQDFARRLMKSVPIEVIFGLGQAGWSTDNLMRIAVQRIGDTENMSFAHIGSEQAFRAEAEKLELFDRVIKLMQRLDERNAFEVLRVDADEDEDLEDEPPLFRFARTMTPELRLLADELKGHLGLDPGRDSFEVTNRLTYRHAREILIQTRSMLAMMSFVSRSVDVPEADAAANRVRSMPPDVQEIIHERGPLRIRSQIERPEDPYVAVPFRDHWFFIQGDDHRSKRAFTTLLVLFELLAPGGGGAAPLLSLPTG